MRLLDEVEHERLLSIERAYRLLREERRPYTRLRRWVKGLLLSLGHAEDAAERTLIEIELRPDAPPAYLLRRPENEGSQH
jgi:hypothetical protein